MKNKTITGQLILNIFFVILSLTYIIPFLLLISISLSSDQSIREFGYTVFPKIITFDAYKMIFKSPETILNAYEVTIIFSLVTMVLSVIVMTMVAYPLSRKNCVFRKPLSYYIFFTMIFSGGMIPSYIIFIFVEIYTGALRGVGDVFIPTLITLGGVGLIRLPWLLFIVPLKNELSMVMISYPLAWIATALLLVPYYYYKKKRGFVRK